MSTTNSKKMDCAKRLKRVIELRGLTQKELAGRCGLTLASVNNYVLGKYAPGIVEAERMAQALGVSPGFLAGWDLEAGTQEELGLAEILSKSIPEPLKEQRKAYAQISARIRAINQSLERADQEIKVAKRSMGELFDILARRPLGAGKKKKK